MKPWVKILLLAVVAGVGALLLAPPERRPEEARVGSPAPAFALPSLDGSEVRLEALRGKVVALNFWATWCQPCKEEMPELVSAWRAGVAGCLEIVGIAEESSRADAAAEASRFSIPYPVVLDADGTVARDYGLTAYPRTYVIDGQGVVRRVLAGKVTRASLEAAVEPLLPPGCRRSG